MTNEYWPCSHLGQEDDGNWLYLSGDGIRTDTSLWQQCPICGAKRPQEQREFKVGDVIKFIDDPVFHYQIVSTDDKNWIVVISNIKPDITLHPICAIHKNKLHEWQLVEEK